MGYHILETPDHLHRGLYLFAVDNLRILLSWMETKCRDWTSDSHLALEDRWLLKSVLDTVRPQPKTVRLLARKEAQEFFRIHPEFRPRHSDGFWHGKDYITPRDERIIRVLVEEWEEESPSDLDQDWPEVIESINMVKDAIRSASVEAVGTGIERLREVVREQEGHRQFAQLVEAGLEGIYCLLAEGLRDDARLLGTEESEALEVTRLCRGSFRQFARQHIDALRVMAPVEFEELVAELFAQHGLQNVQMTPIVADGGVDIVAVNIQEGRRSKYIIQCKRNALDNKVGVTVVRELVGSKMDASASHALLVTTSDFTKPAKEFARRNRSQPWGVRLVNYKLLKKLLSLTD